MERKRKAKTEADEEDHEEEERHIECKRRKKKWGLILPENGVIGPDGNPFYHHSTIDLKKEHYKRIKECGIRLFSGNFSATEDRRIRKNWRRFARQHNLTDDDIWKFLPPKRGLEALGVFHRGTSMIKMIIEEDFWCKMCRKLDERIGRQVMDRMCIIFNPFYLSGEAFRPWTTADDDELLDLMKKHGRDYSLLAFKVHRTVKTVERRIRYLMDREAGPLIPDGSRLFGTPRVIPHGDRLLDCVCRVAHISNIFTGMAPNFDFSTLNFDEVAKLMGSNEDASKLRKKFFKKKLPLLKEVFERCNRDCRKAKLFLTQYSLTPAREEGLAVIPLLMEHNVKALKDIDLEKFEQQLVDSGYIRSRAEAADKSAAIAYRIGRNVSELSTKRLHVQLTFNEKLRLLLEIYKDPRYTRYRRSVLTMEKVVSLFRASNSGKV